MKQIKFFIPVILFVFSSSCIDRTIYYDVDACFQVSGNTHYVNETVYFVDCSTNAGRYEWDFDDGTTSNQRNPDHIYTEAGTYQVVLRASDVDYRSAESYTHAITIQDIITTTDLDIMVLYYGTEDAVSNCEVTLFDNETDWENLNLDNNVDALTTGANGIVVFEDLDNIVYYIDAYKNALDNSYYSNYYQGYATEILTQGIVNEYNIYVELLTPTSKSERGKYKIKYIEKSSKEEHDRIIKTNKSKK